MILTICSAPGGMRRGGVRHNQGKNFFPEDRFSDDEMKLILEESRLLVQAGLDPTEPGLMSDEELHKALESLKAEFSKTEPRELLVKKLKKAIELAGSAQEPGDDADVEADLIKAARQAIADGKTIASGAPDLDAMAKILDRNVTAAERNQAWDAIQAEG